MPGRLVPSKEVLIIFFKNTRVEVGSLELDTPNFKHLQGVGDNHEGVVEFWEVTMRTYDRKMKTNLGVSIRSPQSSSSHCKYMYSSRQLQSDP
jgi:hypothetical protein